MRVGSLGQEDDLQGEMATQSSILAWKIPWTEEPAWLQSMRLQRWDTTDHGHTDGKLFSAPNSTIFQYCLTSLCLRHIELL